MPPGTQHHSRQLQLPFGSSGPAPPLSPWRAGDAPRNFPHAGVPRGDRRNGLATSHAAAGQAAGRGVEKRRPRREKGSGARRGRAGPGAGAVPAAGLAAHQAGGSSAVLGASCRLSSGVRGRWRRLPPPRFSGGRRRSPSRRRQRRRQRLRRAKVNSERAAGSYRPEQDSLRPPARPRRPTAPPAGSTQSDAGG